MGILLFLERNPSLFLNLVYCISACACIDLLIIFRLPKLIPCLDINDPQFDGVVVVTDTVQKLVDNKLDKVAAAVQGYAKVSSLKFHQQY